MKKLLIGLTLLASISSFATGVSVNSFLGKTYESDKYIVSFSKVLSKAGEVQAVLEEKKFLFNAKRDIPVVRVSDGYIMFYYDDNVDGVQFWGASARLEKIGEETQFCFPLPNYEVDCLSKVK